MHKPSGSVKIGRITQLSAFSPLTFEWDPPFYYVSFLIKKIEGLPVCKLSQLWMIYVAMLSKNGGGMEFYGLNVKFPLKSQEMALFGFSLVFY